MITIIDYGVGNLLSIKNMFKRIGIDAQISTSINDIEQAEKLILPGVGHFDYGMKSLQNNDFVTVLNQKVLINKTPILGICLGVQLFTENSEEGKEKGLGWIKGNTIAFDKTKLSVNQKIPHMGWCDVNDFAQSKLFTDMYDEPRFYFVHSYHLQLQNENDCLATATYAYNFSAGVEHDNIVGVQFHPEKSHKYGMKLLENFVKYY